MMALADTELDDLGYTNEEQRRKAIPLPPPVTRQPVEQSQYVAPTTLQESIPQAPPVTTTPQVTAPTTAGLPPPVKQPGFAERFSALQAERPQANDPRFKVPGWKKGLGAAFSVLGGLNRNVDAGELYRGVAEGPYRRAEQQWEQKGAGLEHEAKLAEQEQRMKQLDMVPVKVPWSDQPIYVQQKDVAQIERQIGQGATQKEITGEKTASAEKIATGKETSAEKIATGKEASAEKIASGKEASAEKIAEGKNLTAKDIANARNMVNKEIAQIRAAAGNDPNKLTMATKNIMQLARSLQPEIDTGIDLTQKMQNIGPISSRWRDLWANKIGTPDPRFVEYKDHIGFLMTGITLAHARGRMSNELFEHFMEMFNAGKQSPENMVAALQVAKHWMDNYANLDKTATQTNPTTPQRPKGVPEGAIWNDKVHRWQMPTAKQ